MLFDGGLMAIGNVSLVLLSFKARRRTKKEKE